MNRQVEQPKISIITPSLNQGRFIERAIQSVLGQNYPNLEYIVIDGGSTDETLTILTRYQAHLRWVSEADDGQAHAINKGFRAASGEILGWLNADDELLPGTLHTVTTYFRHHPEAMLVYGDAEAIDEAGQGYGRRGNVRASTFNELVQLGDFIVQPATFWRVQVVEELGGLDEALIYCLDYEYWLRIASKYALHYLPTMLARERLHPQAKSIAVTLPRMAEIEKVVVRYGGEGIPKQFRAPQAAVYLMEAIDQTCQTNFSKALHYLKLARQRCLLSFRFWLYLWFHLLALFLGPTGAAKIRLYHNLVRHWYQSLRAWQNGHVWYRAATHPDKTRMQN